MKNFKPLFKSASRATAALVLGVMVSSSLYAAAPAKINYQGKLTDSSGIPINVATNVEFAVENLAGAQQWTSGTIAITPVNGVFSQILDVPETVIQGNTELYLELRVAGTPMAPRQRLVAAPYALAVAAGAVGTGELDTADVDTRYATLGTGQTLTGIKTINADWVNTANPWADNEVSDTLTIGAAGSVAAASVQAGALGANVRVSSVAVNSVYDSAIVGMSASKLTGALPALDGSALTGVTATGVGPSSVGTTQVIDGTITVTDLNTTNVDGRYLTLGTVQTLTGVKTINANWDNTANPWADDEVSDTLTVGAAGSVAAAAVEDGALGSGVLVSSVAVGAVRNESIVSLAPSKISAGALTATVIASSVALNAVTTSQISNNTIALVDLNTGDVDTRYVTTGTAQGITGQKTFTNGVIIGTGGTEIAKYLSSLETGEDVANVTAGSSVNHDITITGAAVGDAVMVTPPDTWPAGLFFNAFVSSANTVRLVVYNPTSSPINPASGSFRVTLIQH